jgi:catechol 2,3-dioxygenase-like lactoylglutathione lyase family enzyme
MSIVGKLLHTRYRVNDLERTVKFYRDILGLEESSAAQIAARLGIGFSQNARQRRRD